MKRNLLLNCKCMVFKTSFSYATSDNIFIALPVLFKLDLIVL